MSKLDLKKELPLLYKPPSKGITTVDVPALRFLMIDGQGDPSGQTYAEAVQALFSVAYTVKFMVKKGPSARDYAVMPLEGLWWADDMSAFVTADRSQWQWTMMIMQPDFVHEDVIAAALTQVREKKDLPGLDRISLQTYHEGYCAQTMHIGPFTEEGPTVAKLHAFIAERTGLRGKHHEIYLSDIRRAAPEKWRTIIRQPMQKPQA